MNEVRIKKDGRGPGTRGFFPLARKCVFFSYSLKSALQLCMLLVRCVHDLKDVWESFHTSRGTSTVADFHSHVSLRQSGSRV